MAATSVRRRATYTQQDDEFIASLVVQDLSILHARSPAAWYWVRYAACVLEPVYLTPAPQIVDALKKRNSKFSCVNGDRVRAHVEKMTNAFDNVRKHRRKQGLPEPSTEFNRNMQRISAVQMVRTIA